MSRKQAHQMPSDPSPNHEGLWALSIMNSRDKSIIEAYPHVATPFAGPALYPKGDADVSTFVD
ncbi:hypothetical protein MesoLj131b_07970 [Mesorhizobium sp. 131-2-5]|nr:hypothetical protein MesoLj131b_07970 [Mesorhizobium sp. 131-2-5]